MGKTNFIIEVANTHGGDKSYVLSLLDEFASFGGHGIKFQPLHPDRIATSDFTWYSVYKELFFSFSDWTEIINKAKLTKFVWLDLFDTYGVEVLNKNIDNIYGIKLQASVLYNEHVIEALSKINCKNLKLIINVSAIEIQEISERIDYLRNKICPDEILIEVGFQSYPTELVDSGLNKLSYLINRYDNRIVFADHIDGNDVDAITLPLVASLLGAAFIEKHVMHSTLPTKYDYFSSLKFDKYAILVDKITNYNSLNDYPFINVKERIYLQNSIQKPIAAKDLEKGKGINLLNDLEFKRSNKDGLSVIEIKKLINDGYILASNVNKGETFRREHFKKAIVAVIVAGRLKSSRLKRKALEKIGTITSVEKCIQSCLQLPQVTYTILATSTLNEDEELKNYTYLPHVIFHQGDPDDVVQRYLDIIRELNIDIVFRVTADMPYVSHEIAEILLKEHLQSGADYTAARNAAVGTAPEVINTQALETVKKYFPSANYSEYMTWYFQNNQDYFNVNIVDLPENYVRNYRLTLDYQEDLDLFNEIQDYFDKKGQSTTLAGIFDFLDENPHIAKMNSHITLKYKTDPELIATLNKVTKIGN